MATVWMLKEVIYTEDYYPADWHRDETVLELLSSKELALEKAELHMKSRPGGTEGEYQWRLANDNSVEKSWELYTKEKFGEWFYENRFVIICEKAVKFHRKKVS